MGCITHKIAWLHTGHTTGPSAIARSSENENEQKLAMVSHVRYSEDGQYVAYLNANSSQMLGLWALEVHSEVREFRVCSQIFSFLGNERKPSYRVMIPCVSLRLLQRGLGMQRRMCIIDPCSMTAVTDRTVSREEALQRERQRLSAEGVTSFQWCVASCWHLYSKCL